MYRALWDEEEETAEASNVLVCRLRIRVTPKPTITIATHVSKGFLQLLGAEDASVQS